jgi:hypothetical protein
LVVPVALLPAIAAGWFNCYVDYGPAYGLALALPVAAGVAGVVGPRLPRKVVGPVLASAIAVLGLMLAISEADLSPYVTLPDWLEPYAGKWTEMDEPAADEVDPSFGW